MARRETHYCGARRWYAEDMEEPVLMRMRLAFEMFEAGVALMRQNLRRRNPVLGDAEIEALLGLWLRERPGAEFGDSAGVPCAFPRSNP